MNYLDKRTTGGTFLRYCIVLCCNYDRVSRDGKIYSTSTKEYNRQKLHDQGIRPLSAAASIYIVISLTATGTVSSLSGHAVA